MTDKKSVVTLTKGRLPKSCFKPWQADYLDDTVSIFVRRIRSWVWSFVWWRRWELRRPTSRCDSEEFWKTIKSSNDDPHFFFSVEPSYKTFYIRNLLILVISKECLYLAGFSSLVWSLRISPGAKLSSLWRTLIDYGRKKVLQQGFWPWCH